MNSEELGKILRQVKKGTLSVEKATGKFRRYPYEELGYSKIDTHRELRKGFPEVIFCLGKTQEQITGIIKRMRECGSDVLATRCPAEVAESLKQEFPKSEYFPQSRVFVIQPKKRKVKGGLLLVVSAGTADIPIAEEAAITARVLGNRVETLYDSGVAGLHRLLSEMSLLHEASAIIAVAGMEGALPSVIGGLVDCPVIAVPTSIGYGAGAGGIAALLGMLNSCSAGVVVVNIDNGFGAGYSASLINQVASRKKPTTKKGLSR